MPPDMLASMVESGMHQRAPGDYAVVVSDPRRGRPPGGAALSPREVLMVDPSAETGAADTDPGPDAGALTGKVVGFRVDVLWRCWDWVVDEWSRLLSDAGVSTLVWRRTQGLAGEEGVAQEESFDKFRASVDVVVSGLGNCGSCTSCSGRVSSGYGSTSRRRPPRP